MLAQSPVFRGTKRMPERQFTRRAGQPHSQPLSRHIPTRNYKNASKVRFITKLFVSLSKLLQNSLKSFPWMIDNEENYADRRIFHDWNIRQSRFLFQTFSEWQSCSRVVWKCSFALAKLVCFNSAGKINDVFIHMVSLILCLFVRSKRIFQGMKYDLLIFVNCYKCVSIRILNCRLLLSLLIYTLQLQHGYYGTHEAWLLWKYVCNNIPIKFHSNVCIYSWMF